MRFLTHRVGDLYSACNSTSLICQLVSRSDAIAAISAAFPELSGEEIGAALDSENSPHWAATWASAMEVTAKANMAAAAAEANALRDSIAAIASNIRQRQAQANELIALREQYQRQLPAIKEALGPGFNEAEVAAIAKRTEVGKRIAELEKQL